MQARQHEVKRQKRAKPQRIADLPLSASSSSFLIGSTDLGNSNGITLTPRAVLPPSSGRQKNVGAPSGQDEESTFDWPSEIELRQPEVDTPRLGRDGGENFAATTRHLVQEGRSSKERKTPRGQRSTQSVKFGDGTSDADALPEDSSILPEPGPPRAGQFALPEAGQRSAPARAPPTSARSEPSSNTVLPKLAAAQSARSARTRWEPEPKPRKPQLPPFDCKRGNAESKGTSVNSGPKVVVHPPDQNNVDEHRSPSKRASISIRDEGNEKNLDQDWNHYAKTSEQLLRRQREIFDSRSELPKLLNRKSTLDHQDHERGRLKQMLRDGRVDMIQRELRDRVEGPQVKKKEKNRAKEEPTKKPSMKELFETIGGRKKSVMIGSDFKEALMAKKEKETQALRNRKSIPPAQSEQMSGAIRSQLGALYNSRKTLTDVRKSLEVCILPSVEEKAAENLKRSLSEDLSSENKLLAEAKKESAAMVMHRVSQELHLPPEDIQKVKRFFDSFDDNGDQVLSKQEFYELVAAVIEVDSADDIPEDFKHSMWLEADLDDNGTINFEEFAKWYSVHGFLEDLLLDPSQKEVRHMARKYEMSLVEVENIKSKFDQFDTDGSGEIEIDEFSRLIYLLLRVPPHLRLPPKRVTQFWNEIDYDCSGVVDFEEFLVWYMRYFGTGDSQSSPIEDFYRSVRRIN